MPEIAILHFAPPEQYPPLQNLLDTMGKQEHLGDITLYTTTDVNQSIKKYEMPNNFRIVRLGKSGKGTSSVQRYLTYLRFNVGVLFALLLRRPQKILYYETISSWPACLYKLYFNAASKLFIHYHEYSSVHELNNGMFLVKYFHKLENKIYPLAEWISHTNKDRMDFFKKDILPVEISNDHLLPNYPPQQWYHAPKEKFSDPIKVVYVGAVSTTTMFMKEFADWVANQNGKVEWHIYTANITDEAKDFFKETKGKFIILHDALPYNELPEVLTKYDIGVILYKGHIPNYVYNAPNKLFEYLACGLEVWFPNVIIGSLPYQDIEHSPKVMALDLNKLKETPFEDLRKHSALLRTEYYFCENVLGELINKLIE